MRVRWIVYGVFMGLVSVRAWGASYFDAGVKFWYAEPQKMDIALMAGPSAVWSFGETVWVRGFYLYGDYEYVQVREPRKTSRLGVYDAELVGGINWHLFHMGAGFRWSSVLESTREQGALRVRNKQSFGPVLVAGMAQSLAEWPWGFEGSPWGWYTGVSWMLADFDDDNGEHLNIEAGITHMSHGIYKSIGYRFKESFDHERMEGVTATLMIEF